MKEKKLTIKQKWIVSISLIAVIVLIAMGIYFIATSKGTKEIQLISEDPIVLEYGEPYEFDLKDIIKDYDKLKEDEKNEIRYETTLENEKDKNYPAVGEYEVVITSDDTTLNQKIEVKDTTAPELILPESIEILQGTDLATYDFKSFFEAKDLSELEDYEIDYSTVDISTVGDYTITVSIADVNKNVTEKEIKCIVIAKATENEETTTEIVTQDDGTKKVVVKKTQSEESTTTPSGNTATNSKPSSGGTVNSKPSGSGNNSGSSKPSSGGTTTPPTTGGNTGGETTTTKPTQLAHCTNNNNHSMAVGNCGKWYSSRDEGYNEYLEKMEYWEQKYLNGEITYEELGKKCPSGYEVWTCMYCGKCTYNYKYR